MGIWIEPCAQCGIPTYAGVVVGAYDRHESDLNRIHCDECRAECIYCRDCRAHTQTCDYVELCHVHAGTRTHDHAKN